MTDRELMQQALEALENAKANFGDWWPEVIIALRERLAQPVQPQWHMAGFSTPPRREWVGLTLEEIGLLTTGDGWAHLETPALALFARAIEAKLKEKNA